MGRPTDYTEEIGLEICEKLALGNSLNRITQMDSMPSISTVYRWHRQFPEFRKKYELAREDQVETFADELIIIADNTESDQVQRDRLKIDTRKWIAERMKPKKYGAKSEMDVNHNIQEMPTIKINGKETNFGYGDPKTTESTEQAAEDS